MGRPKLPEDQKPVCQTVRLRPQTADYVCQYAIRHHISVYALLGKIIDGWVYANQITHSSTSVLYSQTVTVRAMRIGAVSSTSRQDVSTLRPESSS